MARSNNAAIAEEEVSFQSVFIKTEDDPDIPEDTAAIPNAFQCDICPISLSTIIDFINHKRSHPNKNPFECSKCSKKFSTSSILNMHKETDHPDNETTQYECNICYRLFASSRCLESHRKLSHQNDKQMQTQCDICFEWIDKKAVLRHYTSVHPKAKQIECDICHKLFACKEFMKTHMKIHSSDKSFELHLKTYDGEKAAQCSICHKRFATKAYVKRHIRVHAGKKVNSKSDTEESDEMQTESETDDSD